MSAGFKAKSALINDAGSGMTVPWPTGHHSGDKGILVASVTGIVSTSVPTTPSGWTLIGTAEANNSSVFNRITVWWLDATSGLMASPVVPSGGYTAATGCAQMFTYSGALAGAPDVALATAQTFTDNISSPGVTTTVANDLIIAVATQHSSDANKTISGWACSSLANVLEYSDGYVSSSLGGQAIGLGMACGMARTIGATGAVTATWSSAGSYLVGGMLVIALKPKATVSVTRDATALKWWGSTEDEWSTLFHGDGFATPLINYNCQDVSTTVADSIGVFPMAIAAGTPQFAQPVTGWSRKAVVCRQNVTDLINTGGFVDASNLAVGWLNYPLTNGIGASMSGITFGNGFGNQIAVDTQPTVTKIDLVTHGDAHTNISTPPGGLGASTQGVHLTFLQGDKDAATATVQTDLETLTHATTAADNWGAFALGGNNVQYWQAAGIGALSLAIFGGFATTPTIRNTITDRLNNGPVVVSIAIAPTSATVAPLATQAMTATATRADGSTFSVAATATWSSSSPGVATVSSSGVVTGVAVGTTNITCTYTSLNAATATSNTSVITVSGAGPTLSSVEITPNPATLFANGGTKQLTATGHYSDGSTADITTAVSWTTLGSSVATIGLHTGLLTGHLAGAVTVFVNSTYSIQATVLASAGAANDLDAQTANFYGEDIWFDIASVDAEGHADYVVSPAGDWQDVEGVEALRQSLLRRLVTNPGEWQTLPDFGVGARQYVKGLLTSATAAELEARIRSQFLSDDRVESIQSVTITQIAAGDLPVLKISVVVIPQGRLRQDATLPISISIT